LSGEGDGLDALLALAEDQGGVDREVIVPAGRPIGPADHDLVDGGRLAQAEVEGGVGGGQEPAAAPDDPEL
jgi:hypothetical protein